MRKILLLLVFVPTILFAQNITAQVKRNIESSTSNEFKVTYTFEDYSTVNIATNKGQMQLLQIPDFTYSKTIGAPAIPQHTDLIALKSTAEYHLEIYKSDSVIVENILVAPAREPARDTEGAPEPEFIVDASAYSTDAYFPQNNVSIDEIQKYRGLPLAQVTISPFQYNPVSQQLIFYKTISYKITFPAKDSFLSRSAISETFKKTVTNIALNSNALQPELKQKRLASKSDDPEYIILSDDMFSEAAQKMATWKRQLGYNVVYLENSGWSNTSIKDTLQHYYFSAEAPPSYFLIIGDHDQVPGDILESPSGEAFASDLYYACYDGAWDVTPDIAHGRISVSSAEEADIVINKIINYEATPPEQESFYQNATNCAQFQDDEDNGYATRRFAHTSEDIRDYVLDQGYNVQRIYYTDDHINPTNYNNGYYSDGQAIKDELLKSNGFDWSGGQWDIVDAINSGKFYLFHRDHGYSGGSGWAHPYFVKSSIDNLHNGNLTPVVFSINCHTGEFKLNNCFAEKLHRHEDGGAVGVFAASYYSYSGYNDGLSCGFIDAIFPEPGLIPNFGSGGYQNPNVTPHEQIVTMGDVLNQGLIRMGETWGSSTYTNELFHYFGDPAMKIHTQKPTPITATNADTIYYEEENTFTVSNIDTENVMATLVTNSKSLDFADSTNNEITFNIEDIESDYIIVTLSKYNHIPYIDTIFVAGKPSAAASSSKQYTCDGMVSFEQNSIYNPTNFKWYFGDGATSEEIAPTYEYTENGAFEVSFVAINDFGQDSIVLAQEIVVNRPEAIFIANDTVCAEGSFSFEALADGNVSWYDADTNLLHQGNIFDTEILTESTDYLVKQSALSEAYVGKEDLGGSTSIYANFCGLIFDAYQDFLLESVKVYADGDQDRIIQLHDSLFNVLISDTIFIEDGEQRIELNWDIPQGEKYKLITRSDNNLFYNDTGAVFPYEISEVLSIYETTFIPDPEKYYYAFYDWKVNSYLCHSTLQKVHGIVDQQPVADFAVAVNDPDIETANASQYGAKYFWDFGDGNTSNEENATHLYQDNGTYEIMLITSNSCSSDTSYQTIEIRTVGIGEISQNDFKVYPNPANDQIRISWNSQLESPTHLYIRNVEGNVVKTVSTDKNSTQVLVDIQNLASGMYILECQFESGIAIRKLIVK